MVTVLTLRHVSKSYDQPVLRDCSAAVGAGESVAIVGENGSGKSTLLKIIVGLLRPDGGQVTWHGRIGYCPQELLLYERLTVRENLSYFGAAYGLDRQSIERASQYLFERLNFLAYRGQFVAKLSGGTKQKLNLAIALLHDPDLLVLDEPYQGFDYETYLAFLALVDELRARGKSILVVTHLAEDRRRYSRLLKLVEGHLIDESASDSRRHPDDAPGVRP
jgi:ABC-type multidrug transport system ATPase subunit